MDVDLNLENYTLNDLLTLFNLSFKFEEKDLKQAKKIVLKMHPDKSKLDKKYFLFFSSAYKLVYNIYNFRNKSNNTNTEYSNCIESSEEHAELLKKYQNHDNFSDWFNKMFVQMKLQNDEEETGYDDWLKTSECKNVKANKSNWDKEFNNLKNEKKALVVYNGINDVVDNLSSGSSNISQERMDNYSNNTLFSNNPYMDVKDAYDNPVIPVTHEDYKNKKKYNNVLELQTDRAKNNVEPNDLLKTQQEAFLKKKTNLDIEKSNNVAFELAKQEEKVRVNNELFWSKIKLLK
jgi:hypothetical protein